MHLAAALLPVAVARRRVRHRRLPERPPVVRDGGRLQGFPRRRARAGPPGDDRTGRQPHLRPAPLVPARAPGAARLARARLLRVERLRPEVPGRPDHLYRHRDLELDMGPGGESLLLAPVLLAPARPELRQPPGGGGSHQRHAVVAGYGRGRAAPRRDPLPRRARRHQLREPARDARRHPAHPAGHGRGLRRPRDSRRGESVAHRRAALLR